MYVIVNQEGRFYTGNRLKQKEAYPFLWTSYPKQAKRYQKRGPEGAPAQQVADQWGGQVRAINRRSYTGQRISAL